MPEENTHQHNGFILQHHNTKNILMNGLLLISKALIHYLLMIHKPYIKGALLANGARLFTTTNN